MGKRGFDGIMMRAYGARDHEVVVTGVERITDGFLRLRMHSDTLLGEMSIAPTAYVRFWMPDVADPRVEHQRGYTLNEADAATGDFAVDFVLHEPAGPASAWARAARPGDSVQATPLASTRFDLPEEPPAGYLLIGDSASIPAINGILASLPADLPVELYLEQHDDADPLIPLTAHPRTAVRWIPRRGPTSLAAAIEGRDWSDWSVWAAAESTSLKHVRARLKEEFGFPRSEVHATAYWIHGRAFGTNRSKTTEEASTEVPPTTDAPDDAAAPATRPTPVVRDAAHAPQGSWRAQAGGRLIAPLKPALVIAGVAQAIITLLQLAPFVLLAELARLLIEGADPGRLWALGIWAVALLAAGAAIEAALLGWLHRIDADFARDLRQRLLTKLSRVPLGWFDARDSGQVKQIVQDDILSLHYLVTHAVPDAVAAVVAPVAVLTYLFVVDWRIALVLLLPVLAYIIAMAIMVVQSGPRTAEATKRAERMNTYSSAYLDAQPVTRVFPGAARLSFRARLDDYIRFLGDWQRPMNGQKAFIDLVTRPATFLLLICAVGTTLIATGAMAPVSVLPFLLLGTTFGARLMGVGYGLAGLRTGLIAARRIQVVLDEPELDEHAEGEPAADAAPGLVEFDRVHFSYRPGIPVIDDVSLSLEPGTVTALVGPSGSGKSTLAALLARFHDVGGGAIRVGGRDVRSLSPDALYASVGFVFQQTQLVEGTVRENIALAVPDAPHERIVEAARAAQIHERILRLPQGYDTVLGRDAALSGGERQRLTIARAMLADAPVLVLDEATAFADPESEHLVQQALNRLTVGRTVLVIAHRLHTVTGADRIVVLDGGRIAEQGTHDELLAADGRYRSLWEAAAPATAAEEGVAR